VGTPLRRRPTATGAVQHVHIIEGRLTSPPKAADATRPGRSSTRSSQSRGTSVRSAALISSAATSALQTASPYS
jgi:hypothetical protein